MEKRPTMRELMELHYDKKLSSIAISKMYGVNSRTVRYWFKKFELPMVGNTFQVGRPNPKNSVKSKKEIERIIALGKSNKGRTPWNKGRKSEETTGERNHNWKGDKASYVSIHHWLYRNFDKLGLCEWCNSTGKTEWANKNGEYRRVRDDYYELCRKCHINYDKNSPKLRDNNRFA